MVLFALCGCAAQPFTNHKTSQFQNAMPASTFCSHIKIDDIEENALKYYQDSAFIGDSRADTIKTYDLFQGVNVEVYAASSLDLNKVFIKNVILLDNGAYGTLLQAIKQKPLNKIYISFGLNELGWFAMDVFENQYISLVNEIKSVQPNAQIYLMSVYPFAQSKVKQYDYTTLEKLQIINDSIANVAQETGSLVFDQAQFIPEGQDYLPEKWSDDGYHLNKEGADAWLEMMIKEGEGKTYEYEKNPCIR